MVAPHTHPETDIVKGAILARLHEVQSFTNWNIFNSYLIADTLGLGLFPVPANVRVQAVYSGGPATGACLTAVHGASWQPVTNTLYGVGGFAYAYNAANVAAYGLDFRAGALGVNPPHATVVNARAYYYHPSQDLTLARGFYLNSPTVLTRTVALHEGVTVDPLSACLAWRPFKDMSPPAAAGHSIFASTAQFFSTTPAFGGGVGVMGIANAAVSPSTNPAGGGVLYATGGALRYRGSGGTDTLIAAA